MWFTDDYMNVGPSFLFHVITHFVDRILYKVPMTFLFTLLTAIWAKTKSMPSACTNNKCVLYLLHGLYFVAVLTSVLVEVSSIYKLANGNIADHNLMDLYSNQVQAIEVNGEPTDPTLNDRVANTIKFFIRMGRVYGAIEIETAVFSTIISGYAIWTAYTLW